MIIQRFPFYEVSPDAYLFQNRIKKVGEQEQPEEPVRQWCAFELIRCYGFRVTDLVFEQDVKVGSKRLKIDIVVLRNGAPWAIVECKRPEHRKAADGMDQAISYAAAESIRAKYAVYTNGQEWMVKQYIGNIWVPVPDLPNAADPMVGREELLNVLRTFEELLPVLHALDESLEGDDAENFISILQEFFCGENLVTQGTSDGLRSAIDNLLRVISSEYKDVPYQLGKLTTAHRYLEQFRLQRGIGFPIDIEATGGATFLLLQQLHHFVVAMAKSANGTGGADPLALRLAASVLEAGADKFRPQSRKLRVTPAVQQSLREYLDYGLRIYLGMSLPSHFDSSDMDDMRRYTQRAWDAQLVTQ
jgi:hypothetical protein